MDYLTLRIPADIKEKITSTTWTGEPPWQGSNGMYEQCGCDMIQVVPAAYEDVRSRHVCLDAEPDLQDDAKSGKELPGCALTEVHSPGQDLLSSVDSAQDHLDDGHDCQESDGSARPYHQAT